MQKLILETDRLALQTALTTNTYDAVKGDNLYNEKAHLAIGTLRRTTVSAVSPGPKPKRTPQSKPSPVVASPSLAERLRISSRMKSTQALDMLPYSARTWRVARRRAWSRPSSASAMLRMAGPPGCATQKILFQSEMPSGLNAVSSRPLMFMPMRSGTLSWRWKVRPSSRRWPRMASSESGTMVCWAVTSWNSGRSPAASSGPAPTTTAAAPSPKSAWPIMESMWVAQGPRKVTAVISEQMMSTRAPRLFSARSFATRSTVPPAKQP
ncbi:hypothetical protein EJB05_44605, partial [Eragrostis curvula]